MKMEVESYEKKEEEAEYDANRMINEILDVE